MGANSFFKTLASKSSKGFEGEFMERGPQQLVLAVDKIEMKSEISAANRALSTALQEAMRKEGAFETFTKAFILFRVIEAEGDKSVIYSPGSIVKISLALADVPGEHYSRVAMSMQKLAGIFGENLDPLRQLDEAGQPLLVKGPKETKEAFAERISDLAGELHEHVLNKDAGCGILARCTITQGKKMNAKTGRPFWEQKFSPYIGDANSQEQVDARAAIYRKERLDKDSLVGDEGVPF
jgi:hypothetical protein